MFDNVQRAVYFNWRDRGEDKMLSTEKKETLEKKVKKAFIELFPKDKINANKWISIAERIEQVKKAKFESEFIKNLDFFPGGYGKYDIKLISFTINSFN